LRKRFEDAPYRDAIAIEDALTLINALEKAVGALDYSSVGDE